MLPTLLQLVSRRFRKSLREAEHQTEHVLRHGAVVDPARVGENDVAVDELRKQHRIDTGAGPVYPAQTIGVVPDVTQVRLAEAPAEQHFRTRKHFRQLLDRTGKAQLHLRRDGLDARHLFGAAGTLNDDNGVCAHTRRGFFMPVGLRRSW